MTELLANRLYNAQKEKNDAEEAFDEFLESIGVPLDYEELYLDEYDGSFELCGASPDLELTQEQQDKLWAIGFSRCWLCEGTKQSRYSLPDKYYYRDQSP